MTDNSHVPKHKRLSILNSVLAKLLKKLYLPYITSINLETRYISFYSLVSVAKSKPVCK